MKYDGVFVQTSKLPFATFLGSTDRDAVGTLDEASPSMSPGMDAKLLSWR